MTCSVTRSLHKPYLTLLLWTLGSCFHTNKKSNNYTWGGVWLNGEALSFNWVTVLPFRGGSRIFLEGENFSYLGRVSDFP